jgi:hypothetical protein
LLESFKWKATTALGRKSTGIHVVADCDSLREERRKDEGRQARREENLEAQKTGYIRCV